MNTITELKPMSNERAKELFELFQRSANDSDTAIILNARGEVQGLTHRQDEKPEHLLGDLDVHA